MFQHVFLAAEQLNIVDLIKDSTGAVMAVLVILVAMSLVSWYIIAMKAAYLSKARRQSDKFQEVFWHSKRLDNTYKEAEQLVRSPVAQMFRAGYVELTKLKKGEKERDKDAETMELSGIENVERALRRASLAETTELEKNLSCLALGIAAKSPIAVAMRASAMGPETVWIPMSDVEADKLTKACMMPQTVPKSQSRYGEFLERFSQHRQAAFLQMITSR